MQNSIKSFSKISKTRQKFKKKIEANGVLYGNTQVPPNGKDRGESPKSPTIWSIHIFARLFSVVVRCYFLVEYQSYWSFWPLTTTLRFVGLYSSWVLIYTTCPLIFINIKFWHYPGFLIRRFLVVKIHFCNVNSKYEKFVTYYVISMKIHFCNINSKCEKYVTYYAISMHVLNTESEPASKKGMTILWHCLYLLRLEIFSDPEKF